MTAPRHRLGFRGSSSPLGAALLIALAGCGGFTAGSRTDSFVPSPELARAALDASLTAWQAGKPTGPASALGTRVEVSDSERDPARPLRRFAILGPIGTDDQRGFAVRLAFDNPPETRVTRYLVVGTNPVWVFRQEDYERISHWEHAMDPLPDAAEVAASGPEIAPTQTTPHDHGPSDPSAATPR